MPPRRQAAFADPAVQRHLQDKEPRKVIVVPGRLVNVVV
jgi:leucyl-tRNA synthetase